jgi:hypothetical protein
MKNYVQIKHPIVKRYIKIDKDKGDIIGHKKTPGPYKGIPVVYGDGE